MSDTILSGDLTVYYANDTGGDLQIRWTGSAAQTATRTLQEVYSALMDLFDESAQMDEGIPIRAVTAEQYFFGIIESNSSEPWFIDNFTTEHLTGGGVETLGWGRVEGSAIGIVKVQCSGTGFNLVTSDIGDTITHTNGDSGKILDVDTTNFVVYIRPDSFAAANNFDDTSGTLTASTSSNTATQTAAAATGNSCWSGVFSVGTIQGDEQLYVAQDGTVPTPWWPAGSFNRLFLIKELDALIDNGYLTVYSRKVNYLYDNFLVDASGGGANVASLTSSPDLNNETVGAIAPLGITISYNGPYTADINDNAVNEDYSIQVNCNSNSLSYVYEYLKYITRYTSTTSLNGVEGQQYIGIDFIIDYASETGTVNIGDEVTGSTSGATGFVVNKNTTSTYVTLMNSEGTFVNGENLTIGGNSLNTTSNTTAIAPSKQAPFGTFAGGRFFGAFGVLLTNVPGADVNNYQLIADDGVTYEEPVQRTFTITNIQPNTEVRLFTQTNLIPVAGKEDVGGTAAADDVNFVQTGPDANGLYSLDFTYIYGNLATDFPTEVDGSNNLPIFVVAQSLNFQFQKFTFTLENVNGSLQLAQIEDRQYF